MKNIQKILYLIFSKSDLVRKIEHTRALPLVETIHTFQSNNAVVAGLHIQDNLLASGSRDACVRLWDLKKGTCVKVLRVQNFLPRTSPTNIFSIIAMQ